MPEIRCDSCGAQFPLSGVPYRCPTCGGIWDYANPPTFTPNSEDRTQPGMWRFMNSFGLFPGAPVISLGEGNTPLVWTDWNGAQVGLKLEYQNPTGSYKDRGSAVLVSQLLARGVKSAVEDSSGNAGASFAAYAARAGLKARVYVPESASGPKRVQIETYGADLVRIPGPRAEAARAVLQEVENGAVYASHAYLPFGLMGIATIAYEIWQQLGRVPGAVIAPTGHGGLLLGIVRGFSALQKAGMISTLPYYVGVQAAGCAPTVAAWQHGLPAIEQIVEAPTVAEGVRVRRPIRVEALLREIKPGQGEFIAIAEDHLLEGYKALAGRGFYVEPTSALAWCAYQQISERLPGPVVLVLTGSGYKVQSL